MTLVVDAAPLVAAADDTEPLRAQILKLLRSEPGGLFIPAPVTAEIDHLLSRRLGPAARRAFLADLAARRFEVVALEAEDYQRALEIETRYAGLNPGLVDCSVVLVAHRLRTRRVLTFDQRHFRAIQPLDGGAFKLLPADEPGR